MYGAFQNLLLHMITKNIASRKILFAWVSAISSAKKPEQGNNNFLCKSYNLYNCMAQI